MKRKLIVIIGLTITVLILTGCITPKRETGTLIKEGKVTAIQHDVIFGGTFTDWRDDIYFDDGTVLSSQGKDLSLIVINQTGRFYFEKNYFEYDDAWYKFDNFIRVEYFDDGI